MQSLKVGVWFVYNLNQNVIQHVDLGSMQSNTFDFCESTHQMA